MALTFKRGIHPNEEKHQTEHMPIKELLPAVGSELVYPLSMHIGAPCTPIVEIGQRVLAGEKIGDSEAFVSAPIHSSVSGTVKDIRPHLTAIGTIANAIIIENDGEYAEHESIKPRDSYENIPKAQLLKIIREGGVVGLGGAGFPTHVKLSSDKKIDTLIINGCECEPYLTTDNSVMLDKPEEIVMGAKIIQHILGKPRCCIGIEDNKPEAIAALTKAVSGVPNMDVVAVKTKYPQGAEKQLINAITKREVPSGKLPADVGCVVNNVDTAIAVYRSVSLGRPLMRKVITLTGESLVHPGNYITPIGTKIADLVEMIGGYRGNLVKIVVGGPMMGVAIYDINVPVVKTTSGLLCLTEHEAEMPPAQNCIRCGRCVEHCPMGLVPISLDIAIYDRNIDLFKKLGGMDCVECGCCSYVCPAKRYLAQAIRSTRRIELSKPKK